MFPQSDFQPDIFRSGQRENLFIAIGFVFPSRSGPEGGMGQSGLFLQLEIGPLFLALLLILAIALEDRTTGIGQTNSGEEEKTNEGMRTHARHPKQKGIV